VETLGPEVDDRHLVLGLPLRRLEDVHRLELDAPDDLPRERDLQRPDDLERRDDLAEVAVVAVILVADDDDVSPLADRLVPARVGRTVRVEDGPESLGLDQERRVAIPSDAHGAGPIPGREAETLIITAVEGHVAPGPSSIGTSRPPDEVQRPDRLLPHSQ
jgi:hypothetical protein